MLFAATSHVSWALLLARSFDADRKACPRGQGRLFVRVDITELAVAREPLDSLAEYVYVTRQPDEEELQDAVVVLDQDYHY